MRLSFCSLFPIFPDLAAHILYKNGISAIRRLRKTDNNRIARATGATIVSRTSDIEERDIGTGCGLFEIRKIGDTCVCIPLFLHVLCIFMIVYDIGFRFLIFVIVLLFFQILLRVDISPSLKNARNPRHARFFFVEHPKICSMKLKETYMMLWVLLGTSCSIHDCFLVEVTKLFFSPYAYGYVSLVFPLALLLFLFLRVSRSPCIFALMHRCC